MTILAYPYRGTLAELRRIRNEIAEVQAERRQLDEQEAKLREHEANCIQAIRTNSRGGR